VERAHEAALEQIATTKPRDDVVFRPAPGAVVVVNGDLTMYGSHAIFRGGRRPDGTYTLQARRLRSEMRSLGTASRHVVFENVKAATFLITGTRFITIRGGDFGPNVACWPRGRTGAGDYGAPIAPETWCPEGSGYEETGNAADFQAKIGPNGAVPRTSSSTGSGSTTRTRSTS